jgi:hypothetical protein
MEFNSAIIAPYAYKTAPMTDLKNVFLIHGYII